MHCPHSIRAAARSAAMALAAYAPCALDAGALGAQSGPPPPAQQAPQQPALTPYRAPVIALVQPAGGGQVPQDKPVVVFRFAQGEPADPIDAASFAVAVDGADRSALFQVTATEAWGPLAAAPDVSSGGLVPGAHQVTGRVCSSRGACGSVTATVTALPGPAAPAADAAPPQSPSRKKRLLGALIDITRKVLVP